EPWKQREQVPSPKKLPHGYSVYASAESLWWWLQKSPVPTLLTTGSLADPVPGALGQPHTEVQHLGGLGLGNPKAGGRFTLGTWVGWDQPVGAETSYFFLGERSSRFLIGSGGLPVLARPFFDANPQSNLFNRENASLVAGPGVASGSVAFAQSSQVWGIEAN